MQEATIHLLDSHKMIEFYVNPDINSLATGLFVEGFYSQSRVFLVADSRGEDVAEELFDLTNNPGRQAERERRYGRGRSLSVGDIVEVDGDMFVCASHGWHQININLV